MSIGSLFWVLGVGLVLADTLKLSLDSALAIAQKNSPYRVEERYHRTAAFQRIAEPMEKILPSPFFNLNYYQGEYEKGNLVIKEKSYQGALGINQPIFSVDLLSGLVSIRHLYRYERAQARLSRSELKYLTTTAYYDLLKIQEVYQVKKKEVAKKESLFLFSAEGYRLNKISKIDLLRSENDYYLAKMEEENTLKSLTLAQENLKGVIGIKGDGFVHADGGLTEPESIAIDFSDFFQNLIQRNPELNAATEGKNLARLAYWSSIFNFLPSVSLSLSSNYTDSLSFPRRFSEWQNRAVSNLSLSLSFPFLDFSNYSLTLLAKSQEKRLKDLQWKKTWLSLYQSASDAYLSLKEAFSRYYYAKKNWELAKELLRLGEEERRLGRISYLDLLDIETKYHNAYYLYIAAIAEIRENEARIEYLLGPVASPRGEGKE
ncbi:MAG: TolC family protein [candidate division WOR-3 bacterium]